MVVINGRSYTHETETSPREHSAQRELPLLWAVSDARGRAELDALVAEVARDES